MKFKKYMVTLMAVAGLVVAGCTYNEAAILAVVRASGSIAVSAWYAVDNPDVAQKAQMKEIITTVRALSGTIEGTSTFIETAYPIIVANINSNPDLNEDAKETINGGVVILLTALDGIIASNKDKLTDAATVARYVNSFCDGSIILLNAPASDAVVVKANTAYQLRTARPKFKSVPVKTAPAK